MLKCSSVGELSRKDPVTDLDLIIIGGGPAGLTAGLYAARANMKAILLDSKDVGGEILNTELIEDPALSRSPDRSSRRRWRNTLSNSVSRSRHTSP